MPLDGRNVPLPPDNDGNEDVLTSQSTNRYPSPPTRAATTRRCPRPARTGRHHGACSARQPGAAVTAR
jgi:hypothetical protein